MAKKKIEQIKEDIKKQAFMSPGQYWEWRTTIEEMNHFDTKVKLSRMMSSVLEKDIEIQKLKAELYKNVTKQHEKNHADSKKEYERFKAELEKQLGVSLNNKVIDDITFEVKDLE